MIHDVAIVGAGPAGASCAAVCARGGLRVVLLERATFPREKVCGDCLNPACWPLLDRLEVADRVRALTHARPAAVEFIGIDGQAQRISLASTTRGEIAVKRSAFDALLAERAAELGAEWRPGTAVSAVEKHGDRWRLRTGGETIEARELVAADGRNSTVARLLGLLPAARKGRIGVQAHLLRNGYEDRVTMRLLPWGYCGIAGVGGGEINLCLAARPQNLDALKAWAAGEFELLPDVAWRTIAPLDRAPIPPVHDRLLFVGDTARVVEPFTGEGIYYALATGIAAADSLLARAPQSYAARHREIYAGRLWVNRLARAAVLHPHLASAALRAFPGLFERLTAKVIRD